MADDIINVRVEVEGAAKVVRYLGEFPEDTYEAGKKVFQDRAAAAHKQVIRNATYRLRRRTGQLARSLRYEVTGNDIDSLDASVYAASSIGNKQLVYAPIHEFGGTVKAKRAYKSVPGGPYLNIPIGKNLTPAGVQRKSAKKVFQDGAAIVRGPSGKFVVISDTDGPMFVLVKRVHIKDQLGMRRAVERQIPRLMADLEREIGED